MSISGVEANKLSKVPRSGKETWKKSLAVKTRALLVRFFVSAHMRPYLLASSKFWKKGIFWETLAPVRLLNACVSNMTKVRKGWTMTNSGNCFCPSTSKWERVKMHPRMPKSISLVLPNNLSAAEWCIKVISLVSVLSVIRWSSFSH